MSDYITTLGRLFSVFLWIVCVVAAQFFISLYVQEYTSVYKGECTFKNWSISGRGVILNVDCQGHPAKVNDPELIVAYLTKPRPLHCEVNANGTGSCEMRTER